MPVIVDMKSIQNAASKVANSRAFKKEQQECIQGALLGRVRLDIEGGTIHTAEEAAEKFVDVLKNHISTSGLSSNAAGAISDFTIGSPACSGSKCTIKVSFAGKMHRQSLAPSVYPGGIDNLEELLDQGVGHTMRPVYGEWNGQKIRSRTTINGAYFIDAAMRDFLAGYGKEYNVTDINVEYEH